MKIKTTKKKFNQTPLKKGYKFKLYNFITYTYYFLLFFFSLYF